MACERAKGSEFWIVTSGSRTGAPAPLSMASPASMPIADGGLAASGARGDSGFLVASGLVGNASDEMQRKLFALCSPFGAFCSVLCALSAAVVQCCLSLLI